MPDENTGKPDLPEMDIEINEEELRNLEVTELREAVAAAEAGEEDAGAEGAEAEALRAEIEDLRDRSMRTLADFDNYRKRIAKERQHERRYATFGVFLDFLGVIDNLERAHASQGSAEDLSAGVGLILKQMRDLLRSGGLERVEAIGKAFDPLVHEAVSRFEDANVSVPQVSEELQPGYLMHDRLLRPALVTVAMPPAGVEEAPGQGDHEDLEPAPED